VTILQQQQHNNNNNVSINPMSSKSRGCPSMFSIALSVIWWYDVFFRCSITNDILGVAKYYFYAVYVYNTKTALS